MNLELSLFVHVFDLANYRLVHPIVWMRWDFRKLNMENVCQTTSQKNEIIMK